MKKVKLTKEAKEQTKKYADVEAKEKTKAIIKKVVIPLLERIESLESKTNSLENKFNTLNRRLQNFVEAQP